MRAIAYLLEALEFARSRNCKRLRMDDIYGEPSCETIGSMIDAAVVEWRTAQADTKQIRHLAAQWRARKAAE